MIAIDTNVLVRLLTRDNEHQYAAAHSLFSSQQIFICDTVILETEWVLRHAYEFTAADIAGAFRQVFGLPNVHLKQADAIAQVILWVEQGLDFADAFHLVSVADASCLKTFDQQFVKRAAGLTACVVESF